MHRSIVDSQGGLEDLCAKIERTEVVAIDTEFVRVRTYYPRFCLMQMSAAGDVHCLDPLRVDLGQDCFRRVLCAPERTTVLHAGRQDIEVLYQCLNDVPRRVFDTQVAAAMLGLGDQIGYAGLVEIVTGRTLAKSHTRTDWCRRPLSADQIDYAIDDVRYLDAMYDYLGDRLQKCGRLDWVLEECRSLSDVGLYRSDPASAYKRVGHGDRLQPVSQSVLKALAIWRERTSQAKDLPRNWILSDATLALIAQRLPDSRASLAGLEGVSDKFVRRHGEEVLAAVRCALREPAHAVIWHKPVPLSEQQRMMQKKIMALLRRVAAESGISPGLLGTRQDVAGLIRGRRDVSLLCGWRARLLAGELDAIMGSPG